MVTERPTPGIVNFAVNDAYTSPAANFVSGTVTERGRLLASQATQFIALPEFLDSLSLVRGQQTRDLSL